MTFSLKTTSYATALFIALILGFLLLLGSRQYSSQKEFEKIIEQNEKIVFQFSTIREHITESLLEGRHRQLKDITTEVEQLNTNLSHILQEPLIPAEYKLAFAGQVDLAGINLLLRSIGNGDIDPAKIRNLNQEVRTLGDRLLLFDRVIVNHVKRKLVSFQSVVIGILAIVLFAIVNILVFWHRQITVPLFDLIKQIKDVARGHRSDVQPLRKSGEVAELSVSFQDLLKRQSNFSETTLRYNKLVAITREVGELSAGSTTPDDIFAATCKALLKNEDYCLAWIGTELNENEIQPITVDASTTLSQRESAECMNALQEAATSNNNEMNAALTATRSRGPVVLENILSSVPRGPFKGTPFSADSINWCALPLISGSKYYGVLNIYSTLPRSFAADEVNLLAAMAAEMSFALSSLETKSNLTREQNKSRLINEALHLMVAQIRPDGSVISLSPEARKLFGVNPGQDLDELRWLSLLPKDAQETNTKLLQDAFKEQTRSTPPAEITITGPEGKTHTIRFRYIPSSMAEGKTAEMIWVGTDINDSAWISPAQARMQSIYNTIFSSSSSFILVLSVDGTIIDCNPAFFDRFEMAKEKTIGHTLSQVLFKEHTVPTTLQDALRKRSGEVTIKFENPARDYHVTIAPLTITGTDENILFVAEDISEHTRSQEDLVKAAKLAAMGELAMGVAHEINNLSNGLINYTQILSEEIGINDSDSSATHYPQELLSKVIQEGERIANTVQQLLLFNSHRTHLLETVQIEPVIADALEITRHLFKNDGIHTTINLPSTLPPVRINVHNMRHVFLTLLSNGRDALNSRYAGIHANKRLEISGEKTSKGEKQFLRLRCTDWGQGISRKNQPKIFDPFFSTKPPGKATGLGLCIAHAFIQELDGTISVESIADDHTMFTIDIPVS